MHVELANLVKNGRRDVILEDDKEQATLWQEAVNRFTAFATDFSDVFPTAEGIDEQIEDLTVGLFLIDIQNGNDETLGIRVAEKILRRRLQLAVEANHDERHPKTHIVVWTSSTEHLALAEDRFYKLVEGKDALEGAKEISYDIGGHGKSGGNSRVSIEVKPKVWQSYGNLVQTRERVQD